MVQSFLQMHGRKLDPVERQYLEAFAKAPFSFFEITAVERRESLCLHDLLLERLGDPVRPARPGDREAIGQLLDRAGITHSGLERIWSEFLVVPSVGSEEIAACVAIEHVEDDALLRMLAIIPERRGEGLGYSLIETAAKKARMEGALHLYLVTDGTQGVAGEKLGFDIIDQKNMAPAIMATDEYQMARSKTATWMRKAL